MLLIDGFNLLRSPAFKGPKPTPGGSKAHNVVDLAHAVARRGRWQAEPCLVCLDGVPSRQMAQTEGVARLDDLAFRVGAVHLAFSGASKEADDLIEAMLAGASKPWACVVVSSDRRLWRACRHAGAESVRADEFARWLPDLSKSDEPEPDRLSDEQVKGWMAFFEQDRPNGPRNERGRASGTRRQREQTEPESEPEKDQAPYVLDPLLREALKEWRDRLSPDDLDMDRWLDHTPNP